MTGTREETSGDGDGGDVRENTHAMEETSGVRAWNDEKRERARKGMNESSKRRPRGDE